MYAHTSIDFTIQNKLTSFRHAVIKNLKKKKTYSICICDTNNGSPYSQCVVPIINYCS